MENIFHIIFLGIPLPAATGRRAEEGGGSGRSISHSPGRQAKQLHASGRYEAWHAHYGISSQPPSHYLYVPGATHTRPHHCREEAGMEGQAPRTPHRTHLPCRGHDELSCWTSVVWFGLFCVHAPLNGEGFDLDHAKSSYPLCTGKWLKIPHPVPSGGTPIEHLSLPHSLPSLACLAWHLTFFMALVIGILGGRKEEGSPCHLTLLHTKYHLHPNNINNLF